MTPPWRDSHVKCSSCGEYFCWHCAETLDDGSKTCAGCEETFCPQCKREHSWYEHAGDDYCETCNELREEEIIKEVE